MINRADTHPIYMYRLLDASVPPEYHRSYTINIMPEKVAFSVDVYGTILLKKDFPITKTGYKSFVTALLALDLKEKKDLATEPPPVGGKSGYLTITDASGNELKGRVYEGWAYSYNTLIGNVAEAVALFNALVPNLEKKRMG